MLVNILLVVPRMIQRDGEAYILPIGLAYISAVLKANGFNVFCLNLNQINYVEMFDELKKSITENEINIVGCGGFSCHCRGIKDVFDMTKKIDENIIILAGGAIITTEPIIMSQYLDCHFGIVGEGEESTVELLKSIGNDNVDHTQILGLVCREQDTGNYIFTGARKNAVNVETLPIPDYKGFGMSEYLDSHQVDSSYFTAMDSPRPVMLFGSRSCPFKCTFCYHSVGDKFRMRSVESIMDEIRYYIKEFKVNAVLFLDDVLFTNEARMDKLCEELYRLNIKFYCQLRVNVVTEEIVKKLKKYGCLGISYGLESHSQNILDSMKKYIKISDMDRALELTYDAELDIQGNFIFGDPSETLTTALETLKWHYKNRKYHISIFPIFTAPGSEIYEQAKKRGIINNVVDFINRNDYVINLTSASEEDYLAFCSLVRLYESSIGLPYILKEGTLYHSADEGNRLSILSTCRHCGRENNHKNLIHKFDLSRQSIYLRCRHCLRRYAVLIFSENIVGDSQEKSHVTRSLKGKISYALCLRKSKIYIKILACYLVFFYLRICPKKGKLWSASKRTWLFLCLGYKKARKL